MPRWPGKKYPTGSRWTVKKNPFFAKGDIVDLDIGGYHLKHYGHQQFVKATNLAGLSVTNFPAMYLHKRIS